MADIVIPHTWVPLEIPTAANLNAINTEIASKFNSYAFQIGKNTAGDLLFVDALYDIGKPGATRPRDGHFSRNVVVGGLLTILNEMQFVSSSFGRVATTRRSNFGEITVGYNLSGVDGSDNYQTPVTAGAPLGYSGVEAKYGGQVNIYGKATATTAGQVITPDLLATFVPSGISFNTSLTLAAGGTSLYLARSAGDTTLSIDATAATNAAQVVFAASGVSKWSVGRGSSDGGNDFNLYNNVLGAVTLRLASATHTASFAGKIVNSINVADDNPVIFSNTSATGYGSYLRGGSGSRYNFHVVNYNDVSKFLVSDTNVVIPATNKLYLDGVGGTGSNTYIHEASADKIQFVVNAVAFMDINAAFGIDLFALTRTVASSSGSAGLRLPHGAAPSSPVDGDVWTTTAGLFVRINGVTKTVTLT